MTKNFKPSVETNMPSGTALLGNALFATKVKFSKKNDPPESRNPGSGGIGGVSLEKVPTEDKMVMVCSMS